MPNVTLSMNEELLRKARDYAGKHQTSLNALIRKLLEEAVRPESKHFLEDCFSLMDRAGGDSVGANWSREDLYDE
jgi:hypothetical protein